MNQTQPIDVMLLRNQLVTELATIPVDAEAWLPLRREFVEQILHALRHPRRAATESWDVDVLRPMVLLEMRRLSPKGIGVSKQRWDQQRDQELPPAQKVCRLLNAQWSALVTDAGLEANRYSRHCDEYNQALDEPSDLELEPEPPDHDGLTVASKRIDVREVGNIRTVTEIYTLR